MPDSAARPAPGSHDPRVPSGTLETSAATLWEAMLAARQAEERDDPDRAALDAFYRTLMGSTLLLPLPPDHGAEARAALSAAVTDEEEVEVSIMLARDADGEPVSVVFGSIAALAAWAPAGTESLPLPARIAVGNLSAAGMPAILDPAGPIPYRFETDELAALAAGRIPGTQHELSPAASRSSVRVRFPGRQTAALEQSLRAALHDAAVDEAYLVEMDDADGRTRLLLGLLGEPGASATVDVPEGTQVVWLEEPLLAQVRAVARPFHRRGGR